MKIGLIIHSQTGNTYAVAQKINEKLLTSGHAVELCRLETAGDVKPGATEVNFVSLPDITLYDALILGAPVHAFSLSAVMKAFLEKVDSLENKKVALFITQQFPHPVMGGNRAISQMKVVCKEKGAKVLDTQIISWSKKNRDDRIDICANKLNSFF